MSDREIDQLSGVETTGHVWDGIKELNNPLPRWWLWTLYICIAWAAVYTIFYPAWPGLHSATKGVLGWSSRGQLTEEMAQVDEVRAAKVKAIEAATVDDIIKNNDLKAYAVAGGAALFRVNCTPCHGAGAQGAAGYPNLNDDSWLWGGTADQIYTTISHGIRYVADDTTRLSEMPAFGRDAMLTAEQIAQVSNYVLQLSGQTADKAAAEAGFKIYADNCAACHGDTGQGNQDLGAPALNDSIWLYHGDLASIEKQVNTPKHGVMPAFQARLGDAAVKQLAVYVYSLGGGKAN